MSEGSALQIAGRRVGSGLPTLVIAEIGVNHDGHPSKALELVDVAASCGADAVKIQIFRADTLLHRSAQIADYQKVHANVESPFELLRRYEMSSDACDRVAARTRELGMIPLATPFSPVDVDQIERLDLPAVKVASPDLVNRPLLSRIARTNRPMLISTGAATMDEVATTVGWLRKWRAPFSLLHCISSYPTPADSANLAWIGELANRFAVPIGYSDHTSHLLGGAFAVSAGACIVEKHLTHDLTAEGPDHAASSDPEQFRQYVKAIREAEAFRGSSAKRVLPIEHEVRRISRQSLVICRTLEPGHVLIDDDLTVQRPGTGVPAAEIGTAVGRRLVQRVEAGTMLAWDMLADAA